MVLFSLQHGTLRSYATDHTAMVASRNKLRSIQIHRVRPKRSLRIKNFSLHFLVSLVWRNVHRFVFRGRIHNRYKIGNHNMIATNIFFLFSNRSSNQTLCQDICGTCQNICYCKLANPLTKHTLLVIEQIQHGFSTSKNKSSTLVLKPCKFVQKISEEVLIIKSRQIS